MRWMLRLACVACAAVAVSANAVTSLPPVVRIASGSVRGKDCLNLNVWTPAASAERLRLLAAVQRYRIVDTAPRLAVRDPQVPS
jgi:hypothetical protein